MRQHIIDAVVANAEKHERRHGRYEPDGWEQRDLRYLRRMMEEVGELAAAIDGNHEHPMELEVVQIAGVCLNWLQARGVSKESLDALAWLDAVKHPSPQ